LLLSAFPVRIPLLTFKYADGNLQADLSRSSVGTSFLEGKASLAGLGKKLSLEPSNLNASLDLGMIDPSLSGSVTAGITAKGTLSDPTLTVKASSDLISYKDHQARDIELEAAYADSIIAFALNEASWENQNVTLNGRFDTRDMKLSALLATSPISLEEEALKISGAAEIDLAFYEKLPEVRAKFMDMSVARGGMDIRSVSGEANLIPVQQDDDLNYYVDLELENPAGLSISLIGDLMDRNLLLDARLGEFALMDVYPVESLQKYDPVISGEISSFLTGDQAVLSSHLELGLSGKLEYSTGLDLKASYDIDGNSGMAILDSRNGHLNGQPLDFSLIAEMDDRNLTLHSFNLADKLYLSGSTDLDDYQDTSFEVILRDVGTQLASSYFPDLALPDIRGLDLWADFNRNDSRVLNASLNLRELDVTGLRPLSGRLSLRGRPEQVEVSGGISNQFKRLVDLTGTLALDDGLDARLQARTNELAMADLMYSPLAEGEIDGYLGVYLTDMLKEGSDLSFDAFVMSEHMSIPDVGDFEDIYLKISQTPRLLSVDSLAVTSSQFGKVWGSGALDYNLYTNAFYEGGHLLNLNAEGHFFDWLTRRVDLITQASGDVGLKFGLRTLDGQFMVQGGEISVENAMVSLRDQPEPIRKLNIQGMIDQNRLILNDFSCYVGEGKLTVKNEFGDDPGSHLNVGFLD
ncbi:MAG: hypothetical protein ACP5F3_06030, partial [Candidatus Syntrophosphaera sp.]